MAKIDEAKQQVLEHNVRRNMWAIATMICFTACVVSGFLIYAIPPRISLILVAVFAVATFFCVAMIKDSSKTESLEVIDNPEPLRIDVIRQGLSEDEEIYGYGGEVLREDGDKGYIMSTEVNKLFVLNPIWVHVSDELYRLPEQTVPWAAYLRDYRHKELTKYAALRPDKAVVGLASDIDKKLFESEKPTIEMHKLTRYAVQITDDAFGKKILNSKKKGPDKTVFDGREPAMDDEGHLLPLSKSQLGHEVDIQTLIVSSDGYLMFSRGTKEHPLRPERVIASAACSFLPSEVQDRPVQESMIESIHNKIRVLYDIPDGTDMRSSFCGFVRILSRGGSPEFYCMTRLDMTKDEIIKAHRDPTSEFVEELLKDMVPELDSVEDASEYVADAIVSLQKAFSGDISLSASAMLSVIIDAMHDPLVAGKVMRRIGVIEDERQYVNAQ